MSRRVFRVNISRDEPLACNFISFCDAQLRFSMSIRHRIASSFVSKIHICWRYTIARSSLEISLKISWDRGRHFCLKSSGQRNYIKMIKNTHCYNICRHCHDQVPVPTKPDRDSVFKAIQLRFTFKQYIKRGPAGARDVLNTRQQVMFQCTRQWRVESHTQVLLVL